jgi:hypothetical protein
MFCMACDERSRHVNKSPLEKLKHLSPCWGGGGKIDNLGHIKQGKARLPTLLYGEGGSCQIYAPKRQSVALAANAPD